MPDPVRSLIERWRAEARTPWLTTDQQNAAARHACELTYAIAAGPPQEDQDLGLQRSDRPSLIAAPEASSQQLLRLANEATNGWACYAKRDIEHCEITRLHREIDKAAALAAVETPQPDDGARWGMIRAALTTPDLHDAETRLLAIAAVLHSRDPYTADDIRRTHELFPERRVAVETPPSGNNVEQPCNCTRHLHCPRCHGIDAIEVVVRGEKNHWTCPECGKDFTAVETPHEPEEKEP